MKKTNLDEFLKNKLSGGQTDQPLADWDTFSQNLHTRKGYTSIVAAIVLILGLLAGVFLLLNENTTSRSMTGMLHNFPFPKFSGIIQSDKPAIVEPASHTIPDIHPETEPESAFQQQKETETDLNIKMYDSLKNALQLTNKRTKDRLENAVHVKQSIPEVSEDPDRGAGINDGSYPEFYHKPFEFRSEWNKKGGILIDLRSTEEFNAGHIEGAVNYPYKVSDFEQRINGLPKNTKIFIYCSDGNVSESARNQLWKMKYLHVHILERGVNTWKKSKLPLVKTDE